MGENDTALLSHTSTALLFPSAQLDHQAMLDDSNDPNGHVKRKFAWALDHEKTVTPKDLIEAFGLSGPSAVSEWKRTGRIGMERIPKLALLTGTKEGWWLRPNAPVPPTIEWRTGSARGAASVRRPLASPTAASRLDLESNLGETLRVATRSRGAQRLGFLFDTHSLEERRRLWPQLIVLLATSESMRNAFSAFPPDAPNHDDSTGRRELQAKSTKRGRGGKK